MCDSWQSVNEQIAELEKDIIGTQEVSINQDIKKPSLMDMPVEILIKICTFIDAHFLKHTLSHVCTRFYEILADEGLWKYWVHSKVNGGYPALPDLKLWKETDIDWTTVCIEMDLETRKWVNVKETMRHIVVKDVHYASVDAVLLVNNGEICISGGRDRGMALWNVLDIGPHDQSDNITASANIETKYIKHDAHSGWVWDLTADNIDDAYLIYSASWDNTVKVWDLARGLDCKQTFQCGISALSVVAIENEVLAGLYSKEVLSFDVRSGPNYVYSYKPHRGPVLALKTFNNLVASLSEDKTMAIWDRTAGKLLKSNIKIPSNKAYPVCISWSPSALYIGDSKGRLHLYNPETFAHVSTYEVWPEPPIIKPSSKISGCYQNQGTLIVCSDRGEIKFLYNSYPLQEFISIKSSTFDVTQLRYLNGIMVIGTCDSALEFWVPKERYSDLKE